MVTEENDDNKADDNEMTMDRTHECDGSSPSVSLSATSSSTAVTNFYFGKGEEYCLKSFWASCPIRKGYIERQLLPRQAYHRLGKQSL